MDKEKSAVIFVNGILRSPENIISFVKSADLIIAADGGLNHALSMGIFPQVLIGDLDSATESGINLVRSTGGEIIRYEAEKDETDLELALSFAIRAGVARIYLVGALGGRTDHWLANIMLLTDPSMDQYDVHLLDGQEDVFLIRTQTKIKGNMGDLISLIPISETVSGVTTVNLRYPLDQAILYRFKTRGISNEMLTSTAEVKIKQGILLCVHNFQNKYHSQEKN